MSNASQHQAYVDQFRSIVRHLAQQKMSKLRAYTDYDSDQSETGAWNVLSAAESAAKTRKMATPEGGRVWTRRIAIATPFNDGEVIEQEDPYKTITDPKSEINRSLGMSMGRRIDDVIIAAATGNAVVTNRTIATGDTNPTNSAFPAGQIVGDYTTPISFDAVTAFQELFLDNDIDLDVPKVAVIGPRQVRKLMQTTQATSSDYTRGKLEELSSSGIVPGWMGFDWIVSTRLNVPAANQLDCLFFTKQALGLHMPMDVVAFCERDPSLSYAWRPYVEVDLGAVRIEDEQIVWFKADNTAL